MADRIRRLPWTCLATLCRLGPRLRDWKEADVHAVLVVRRGKLVYENYFTGTDEPLGHQARSVTFDGASKHDLRSIETSVVSLLVGIAIGQGKMAGIDLPVLPMLAGYADLRSAEKDRVTLRHVVTMSLGLTWNEDLPIFDSRNNETKMYLSPDPVRYALEQPVEFPPGTAYRYNSGSVVILGAMLEKATCQKLDDYARTVLFAPLGIADFEWVHLPMWRDIALRASHAATGPSEDRTTGAGPWRLAWPADCTGGLGSGCHHATVQWAAAVFLRLPVLAGQIIAARTGGGLGGWHWPGRAAAVHCSGVGSRGCGACRLYSSPLQGGSFGYSRPLHIAGS